MSASKRETSISKSSKKRTEAQKIGRLRSMDKKLERIEQRLETVDSRTKAIFYGLGDLLDFTKAKNYIEDVMIRDEVDSRIFSVVFSAGEGGIYPKDIAKELHHFRLDRWRVTRRIQRMNRTLRKETGRKAFRKVGWKWATTRFIQKVWGLPEEEVKEEGQPEEEST